MPEVTNIIYPLVFENQTGLSDKESNQVSKITRNLVANLYEGKEEEAQSNFLKIFDFNSYDAVNSILSSEAVLRDLLFLIFNISLNPSKGNFIYNIFREEVNLKGRADIVIENLQKEQKPRIVIELKIAENEVEAQRKLIEALEQIKSRDYGNNGIATTDDIKRYAVVFYQQEEQSRKFDLLLKGLDLKNLIS